VHLVGFITKIFCSSLSETSYIRVPAFHANLGCTHLGCTHQKRQFPCRKQRGEMRLDSLTVSSDFRNSMLLEKKNPQQLVLINIGIQPLGRSGQRPELSQATGMALVRCILRKFFGVVCHCFPPAFRRSHFRHQVPPRPPQRGRSQRRRWNCGRQYCPVILPK
jgi:hypothetical protein